MQLSRWLGCQLCRKALFLFGATILSFAQEGQVKANPGHPPKHFDHVLIVVLENQSYDSAIKNDLLKSLAQRGAVFSSFGNLYHYSYPNYLAMIAGSDFGVHTPQLLSDQQRTFKDDSEHRTIGDSLNWRNYAEDYPASASARAPFLGDRQGRYVRKHVPFLSFRAVQNKSFHNVVGVNTHAPDNAFVTDIGNFIADPEKHPLPEYIYYSPNLDDDGHDPTANPQEGLKKSADWLRMFLTTWLHFDDETWIPKDEQLKRTLVIVTYDESEGNDKPERIYTVFLGAMVKAGDVKTPYNHYSVLRTIEDNFGLDPIHRDSGDGTAAVISEVWK
ncbi:MAG TPA: alkaline phosphatase family protein [Terriglobales bacterium]|nr:alkaline phosphatase family protein [Terriglobales bacterium]